MCGETIRASWTFSHKKTMVRGIPITGHEGPRGMWVQGCTYLCSLYTAMDTKFSLDTKEWRESSTLRHPGLNPGRRSRNQAPHDPLRKPWLEYNHLFSTLKKHIFIMTSPLWTNSFSSLQNYHACHPLYVTRKKKHFLFEFEKLRQYSGWKAVTSPLAFRRVQFTTPLLQPFFTIRKREFPLCFVYSLYKLGWERRGQHSSALNSVAACK